MRPIITFKSSPECWEKQKSGIKNGIVITFEFLDYREYILRNIMSEKIKKEDVILKIENTETGKTFERLIDSLTYLATSGVEVYIVSWEG